MEKDNRGVKKGSVRGKYKTKKFKDEKEIRNKIFSLAFTATEIEAVKVKLNEFDGRSYPEKLLEALKLK